MPSGPYVYRVTVTPIKSRRGNQTSYRQRWAVKAYWSNSMLGYMGVHRWRWQALRAAHHLAAELVTRQGDNLRLEVTTPDRVQKVYGRDPRSTA